MFCTKCGTKLPDGKLYCPNCGTYCGDPTQAPIYHNPQVNVTNQAQNSNELALVGFILSIIGFCCLGFLSVPGLIFSLIGYSKSIKLGGEGRGFAIAGITLGILGTLYFIISLIFGIYRTIYF